MKTEPTGPGNVVVTVFPSRSDFTFQAPPKQEGRTATRPLIVPSLFYLFSLLTSPTPPPLLLFYTHSLSNSHDYDIRPRPQHSSQTMKRNRLRQRGIYLPSRHLQSVWSQQALGQGRSPSTTRHVTMELIVIVGGVETYKRGKQSFFGEFLGVLAGRDKLFRSRHCVQLDRTWVAVLPYPTHFFCTSQL